MAHDEALILSHEQRITKVESDVEGHDETLTLLTTNINTLTTSFNQVKNWIIGAVCFYVAHEVGIVELLKKLF